jgi:arylsulfatase A-like enzyme
MQINSIKGTRLMWLNETLTIIPGTMQTLGYRTHMIGKWHLDFCRWELTPTYRGSDTFYGFYGGEEGHYNHSGKKLH